MPIAAWGRGSARPIGLDLLDITVGGTGLLVRFFPLFNEMRNIGGLGDGNGGGCLGAGRRTRFRSRRRRGIWKKKLKSQSRENKWPSHIPLKVDDEEEPMAPDATASPKASSISRLSPIFLMVSSCMFLVSAIFSLISGINPSISSISRSRV